MFSISSTVAVAGQGEEQIIHVTGRIGQTGRDMEWCSLLGAISNHNFVASIDSTS